MIAPSAACLLGRAARPQAWHADFPRGALPHDRLRPDLDRRQPSNPRSAD